MLMDDGNIRIRPSSLTTYSDCSRRFAARHLSHLVTGAGYTLRPESPTHIGAAVGSAVHAAAGYTLTEKREHGELGSDSEAEDRAIEEFGNRVEYGVGWDETTGDLSTAKRQIARMSRSYRRHVAPEINPILVETRLEGKVAPGWVVSGQLDSLCGDPDDIIEDLKTGVRQRANGVQYAAYAILFRAHRYQVRGLRERFVPRVRIDREQPFPSTTSIDLAPAIADAWEAIEGIQRDTALFLDRASDPAGRPAPSAFRANPASSLCTAKWCPAWGTDFCRAHKS